MALHFNLLNEILNNYLNILTCKTEYFESLCIQIQKAYSAYEPASQSVSYSGDHRQQSGDTDSPKALNWLMLAPVSFIPHQPRTAG